MPGSDASQGSSKAPPRSTFLPGPTSRSFVAGALVHAVNLPASGDVLFSALRNSGVALSCDFDDARVMTAANGLAVAFFSASDEEPLGDARLLAQAAVERGAEAAVVMCGARGSVGCDHDQVVALEAAAIEPLDTCGAGDSYIAAFLGARLGGRDLESCMRVARGAATATCLSLSALPINDGAPNRSKDKTSTKPGVREVRSGTHAIHRARTPQRRPVLRGRGLSRRA